ncbi:hypothetical protein BTI_49 [Burkholderia thailandensis MSMB121]|uniref:hypothetical protein n=1 Tax=Burkholderia humptydooensis TaxID=430531 RepID=UPI0003280469|nr:hypothetical protein [Burkholderia humptydooensis]AGK46439.1 hypothetical protein BTI_49 [Burkholderia thailandensis MSMB121]ATF35304.1 hypothetical protein CO709_19125 [Burkholderia thailandensis]
MPDRLLITQNAQFYLPKAELTDDSIGALLDAASQNIEKNSNFLINEFRQERIVPNTDFTYTYSARAFPSSRPVYFLTEEFQDTIYAYIVIIEIGKYLSIFKKSCANISDKIDEHFNAIDHSLLTSTFDDEEVKFQKIALRNMTISERAMQARSYEAADLKGLLSTHAAGRSIPYFLKIRQGSNLKTISANSGRVVEASERKRLDEIALWAKGQVHLIENPNTNKAFLDSFAKLVDLSEVLAVTEPSAILIESAMLHDRIIRENIPASYKTRKKKLLSLNKGRLDRIFKILEKVYEVDKDLKVVGYENTSRLRKNEKSITLLTTPLQRIKLTENGKDVSLQKYIIKNGFFSICFDDPKYMYFMGRCFEDSSGISEIDSILDILIAKPEIANVTSEKGEIQSTSTAFDVDSMFGIAETIHAHDDYIFCDDLGNEWADHITLNSADSCICFIHSKHGDVSRSASKLHDVVGQGIKNLGNMYFSKEQFTKKVDEKFSKNYSQDSVQSEISRTRKGDCSAIDDYVKHLLQDYKLHRKAILSCSFISKSAIEVEFNKIKAKQAVTGNIIQLLWILSSFAHAAKDMNVIPIIYCRE